MRDYLEFTNTRTRNKGWWNLQEQSGLFHPASHGQIYTAVSSFVNGFRYDIYKQPGYLIQYLGQINRFVCVQICNSTEVVDDRNNIFVTIRVPMLEKGIMGNLSPDESFQAALTYLADMQGEEALVIPESVREITERQKIESSWIASLMELLYTRNSNTPYLLCRADMDTQMAIDLLALGYLILPEAFVKKYCVGWNIPRNSFSRCQFILQASRESNSSCSLFERIPYTENSDSKKYHKNMWSQFSESVLDNGWGRRFSSVFENHYIANKQMNGIYLNSRIHLLAILRGMEKGEAFKLRKICSSPEEYRCLKEDGIFASVASNKYADGLAFYALEGLKDSVEETDAEDYTEKLLVQLGEMRDWSDAEVQKFCDVLDHFKISAENASKMIKERINDSSLSLKLNQIAIERNLIGPEHVVKECAEEPAKLADEYGQKMSIIQDNPLVQQRAREEVEKSMKIASSKGKIAEMLSLSQVLNKTEEGAGTRLLRECMVEDMEECCNKSGIYGLWSYLDKHKELLPYTGKAVEAEFIKLVQGKSPSLVERDMEYLSKSREFFPQSVDKCFEYILTNPPYEEGALRKLLEWGWASQPGTNLQKLGRLEMVYQECMRRNMRSETEKLSFAELSRLEISEHRSKHGYGIWFNLLVERMAQKSGTRDNPDTGKEDRLDEEDLIDMLRRICLAKEKITSEIAIQVLSEFLELAMKEFTAVFSEARIWIIYTAECYGRVTEFMRTAFWSELEIHLIPEIRECCIELEEEMEIDGIRMLSEKPDLACRENYIIYRSYDRLLKSDSKKEAEKIVKGLQMIDEKKREEFLGLITGMEKDMPPQARKLVKYIQKEFLIPADGVKNILQNILRRRG